MGLFYTVDESVKRALGADGDRNQSALVVDGPLEETTEADHLVELEEDVEELTTEMASMMSDDINELTLEGLMAELGLYLPVVEVRPIRFRFTVSLIFSLLEFTVHGFIVSLFFHCPWIIFRFSLFSFTFMDFTDEIFIFNSL